MILCIQKRKYDITKEQYICASPMCLLYNQIAAMINFLKIFLFLQKYFFTPI